jgi:hypothetical protein
MKKTIALARAQFTRDEALVEKIRGRGRERARDAAAAAADDDDDEGETVTWTKAEVIRLNAYSKYFLAWYLGTIAGIMGFFGFGWTVWGAFFINVGTYLFETMYLRIDLDEIGEGMEFFLDSLASSYGVFVLTWVVVAETLGRSRAQMPTHTIPRFGG